VQEADAIASERFDQIASQLDPSLAEAEALDALNNALQAQVATLRDLTEQLDALAPPDELRDVHDAAVEALEDNIDVTEQDLEAIESMTSMTAAVGELNDEESSAAANETQRTCLALEGAGTQRGITVDLDC
jgi:hypothetical protein